MNLAIIRWRIAPSGGAERFIFDIAKALDERGIEVTLIAEECARAAAFTGRFIELAKSKGGRSQRYRRFQASVGDVLAQGLSQRVGIRPVRATSPPRSPPRTGRQSATSM